MNRSTISVVIPTFHRAFLVREAIQSVLNQTYAPGEILVVDDGSTDDTHEIVRAFGGRVNYLVQPNRGAAAARNLGIQNACGEYIAFLDDDDLWVPEAIEWRLGRLLEKSADAPDIVMGLTQRVTLEDGRPILSAWAARLFGSALVRRRVFERIGPVDETLRFGEDVDWFLRVREQNVPLVFIDKITLQYRIHANNLMSDTGLAKQYLLRVLKKSLARRAAANGGVVRPLAEMEDLQDLLRMMQEVKT